MRLVAILCALAIALAIFFGALAMGNKGPWAPSPPPPAANVQTAPVSQSRIPGTIDRYGDGSCVLTTEQSNAGWFCANGSTYSATP